MTDTRGTDEWFRFEARGGVVVELRPDGMSAVVSNDDGDALELEADQLAPLAQALLGAHVKRARL
jgi:hypothetical protein